jgi:FlaA1/EpsC-like NDP-sugar epimerase
VATEHPMIMSAHEDLIPWEKLKHRLAELLNAVQDNDYSSVRQLLRDTVAGYAPDGEIVDWVHVQRRADIASGAPGFGDA